MSVSRETLHEEVWADPMLKVAPHHKVSGSFLARVCRRQNVLRPALGYSAQVAAKVLYVALPSPWPSEDGRTMAPTELPP